MSATPKKKYTHIVIRLKRNGRDEDTTGPAKAAVMKVGRLKLADYSLNEVLKLIDTVVAAGEGRQRFWDFDGKQFDVEPSRWDHVSAILE